MAGCFPAIFNGQLDERYLILSCLSHVLLLRKRWCNQIKKVGHEDWAMQRKLLGQVIDISFYTAGFSSQYRLPHEPIQPTYLYAVCPPTKNSYVATRTLSGSLPCHFLLKQLTLHSGSPVITFWMNSRKYIQYCFSRKGRQSLHELLYIATYPKILMTQY